MGETRGWFSTLTDPSLLDGDVVLRPARIRDTGACRAARAALHSRPRAQPGLEAYGGIWPDHTCSALVADEVPGGPTTRNLAAVVPAQADVSPVV